MRRASSAIAATLVLGLAATAAGPVRAQTADFGERGRGFVEASPGVAFPLSDLGDVQDPGPAASLGGTYWVHPRVGVRLAGGIAFLRGADAPSGGRAMPDMRVLSAEGGVDVALIPPTSRFRMTAGVGGGFAIYDTDQFAEPIFNPATDQADADFHQAYPTVSGRLKFAYAVEPRIAVFAAGGARLGFADGTETALFSAFAPAVGEEGADLLWTVPATAGVEVRF